VTPEQESRFWPKVREAASGCWEWTASTRNGYGQFAINRRPRPAHRLAYEHLRAEIPDGLVIDHLCRNTRCVNPWHLEPVTIRENALRAPVIGKPKYKHRPEFCAKGLHRMEEHAVPNGKYRVCRPCRRARAGAWGKKLLSPTVEVRP
jgi:hypothetical protein